MSNKKISQLNAATDVTANDLFQVVDIEDPAMASSGTNKKITAQILGNNLPVTATGSSASRSLKDRFADTVNVKDFGAVGDGVTDDTAAFQAAQASGKMLSVSKSTSPYYLSSPLTNTSSAYFPEPTLSWTNFTSNGKLEWTRGFFTDGANGANVWRFKDRVMVGDAADYSGNRLGINGYGNSWVTDKGASYLVKNATMAVAAPEADELGGERYGLVSFSKKMGVGAIAVSDGFNGFARGLYAEGFNYTTGTTGGATGIEVQVGNYTDNFPVVNAYNAAGVQTTGVHIGAESGVGYTTGNDNTPITPPTQPCGMAIDIAGGSINAPYQKWVTGIVFRDGGLYRNPVTNFSTAISMARQHELVWGLGVSAPRVGYIRSDVSNAITPIGIVLSNNTVTVLGAGDQKVIELVDTKAATLDAVNYLRIFNSAAGNSLQLVAAGTDSNIDIQLTSKGTGKIRIGTHTATVDAPIAGYIEIKDASGNLRKLAVIS